MSPARHKYRPGCACARCTSARKLAEGLAQLDRERVAAGTCRHCGGPVPCWSTFGDAAVGERHTTATLRAMSKRERDDAFKRGAR